MEANNESKRTTPASTGTERLKSPLVIGLGALLAVQIIAALILGLGGRDLTPTASQGPLLTFDPETLTSIRIDAPGKEALTLEKSGGRWQIASLAGFPASEPKVRELLDKTKKIEKRLPVGTSETAARRFKVASDNFERRLTLEQADSPGARVVYLGDSPGFRRLFVRADGEQAIYEAELTLFDASEKPDDWTDKTYLHLDAEEIQRLELPDAVLERKDGDWTLLDTQEGEDLDKEAIDEALRGLGNLDFRSVRASNEGTGEGDDQPDLAIRVKLGSDQAREFRLKKAGEGEEWVLKVSDQPYGFELSDYSAQVLNGLNRAGLLSKTEQAPPTEKKPEEAPHEPASTTTEPVSSPGQTGSTVPGAE